MIHSLLKLCGKVVCSNKLTILIYHQVLEKPDPLRPSEPDKDKFRWQMALLNRYFNPISLPEAVKRLKSNTLSANSVCVTFDDGYLNNLTVALPILKEFDIPATVYVASAFSYGDNMWNDRVIEMFAKYDREELDLSVVSFGKIKLASIADRREWISKTLKALKYLPVEERNKRVSALYKDNSIVDEIPLMMTPEQIKELSDEGVNIGGHTHNHPILKGMHEDGCFLELSQNKSLLEKWTGKPVELFAYPNGQPEIDYDINTIRVVEKLGFECAVSTQWGTAMPSSDYMQLKRFTPWDEQPWKFHLRMIINAVKN